MQVMIKVCNLWMDSNVDLVMQLQSSHIVTGAQYVGNSCMSAIAECFEQNHSHGIAVNVCQPSCHLHVHIHAATTPVALYLVT
jgi:hypothetical protein